MNSVLGAHTPHLRFFISVVSCCSHSGHFYQSTVHHFLIPYAGLVHSTSPIHFYSTTQFHRLNRPLAVFQLLCRDAPTHSVASL